MVISKKCKIIEIHCTVSVFLLLPETGVISHDMYFSDMLLTAPLMWSRFCSCEIPQWTEQHKKIKAKQPTKRLVTHHLLWSRLVRTKVACRFITPG